MNENKFLKAGKVKELTASVLNPENAGLRIILNLCGIEGKFESKLEKLLSKRWSKVREDYRYWYVNRQDFKLGSINESPVASDIWVKNILVRDKDGKVDVKSLESGIKKLAANVKYENASLHISTMLTDEVPELKDMLMKYVVANGTHCYFYCEPA
jgi:hypothetical protein